MAAGSGRRDGIGAAHRLAAARCAGRYDGMAARGDMAAHGDMAARGVGVDDAHRLAGVCGAGPGGGIGGMTAAAVGGVAARPGGVGIGEGVADRSAVGVSAGVGDGGGEGDDGNLAADHGAAPAAGVVGSAHRCDGVRCAGDVCHDARGAAETVAADDPAREVVMLARTDATDHAAVEHH